MDSFSCRFLSLLSKAVVSGKLTCLLNRVRSVPTPTTLLLWIEGNERMNLTMTPSEWASHFFFSFVNSIFSFFFSQWIMNLRVTFFGLLTELRCNVLRGLSWGYSILLISFIAWKWLTSPPVVTSGLLFQFPSNTYERTATDLNRCPEQPRKANHSATIILVSRPHSAWFELLYSCLLFQFFSVPYWVAKEKELA